MLELVSSDVCKRKKIMLGIWILTTSDTEWKPLQGFKLRNPHLVGVHYHITLHTGGPRIESHGRSGGSSFSLYRIP